MVTNTGDAQPLCFVIMPFRKEMDSVYEVIRRVGIGAGLDTKRVDEEFFIGRIPEQIHRFVQDASALVAEISERNANVYYELGLAHGLGKPVVLLCRDDTDLPFDVSAWNHVQYTDEKDLRRKLYPILMDLAETAEPPSASEDRPQGLAIARLAERCGFVTPETLELRTAALPAAEASDEGLIRALQAAGDLDEEQAELLTQSYHWFDEYIESVARSWREPTWIKQLHRTVKIVSWRDRSAGGPPVQQRYVPDLGEMIDVYDEAIYTDHIMFQKFRQGTYDARSSGVVMLQFMETDDYKCFATPTSLDYYRSGGGHSLQYDIVKKEGASLPLVVQRSLTYLNGFQVETKHDNRQVGIVVTDPVEELILTVDLGSVPRKIDEVVAELRDQDGVNELQIQKASEGCYYTIVRHPPRGSSPYIRWRWGDPL